MKKVFAIASIAALFLIGCNKNKVSSGETATTSATTPEEVSAATTETENVVAEKHSSKKKYEIPAYTINYATGYLKSGWNLYEEDADGFLVPVAQTETGDPVDLALNRNSEKVEITADVRNPDGSIEKGKSFTLVSTYYRCIDGDAYSFWRHGTLWADSTTIAGVTDFSLAYAVVSSDSNLYLNDDDTESKTEEIIEKGRIIVQINDPNSWYKKIVVYNGEPYGKQVYSRASLYYEEDEWDYHILEKIAKNPDLKPEVKAEIEEVWNILRKIYQ